MRFFCRLASNNGPHHGAPLCQTALIEFDSFIRNQPVPCRNFKMISVELAVTLALQYNKAIPLRDAGPR